MDKKLIIIALLAGLMLASSCNFLRHNNGEARAGDLITDRPIVTPDDRAIIAPSENNNGDEYAPNRLIISYDPEVGTAALDSAIVAYGAEIIYRYHIINAIAIRIPEDKNIRKAIDFFGRVTGVTAVNRDRIYHLTDAIE